MQRASLGVPWAVQEPGFPLTLLEPHQLMGEEDPGGEPVRTLAQASAS